jgi:hypothetical protein
MSKVLFLVGLLYDPIKHPANFRLLILIHLARSGSSDSLYNSKPHLLLCCCLSCKTTNIFLKTLFRNEPGASSSHSTGVQISEGIGFTSVFVCSAALLCCIILLFWKMKIGLWDHNSVCATLYPLWTFELLNPKKKKKKKKKAKKKKSKKIPVRGRGGP